jgi:hypothetical protein
LGERKIYLAIVLAGKGERGDMSVEILNTPGYLSSFLQFVMDCTYNVQGRKEPVAALL